MPKVLLLLLLRHTMPMKSAAAAARAVFRPSSVKSAVFYEALSGYRRVYVLIPVSSAVFTVLYQTHARTRKAMF
jgi:hypothetical protein